MALIMTVELTVTLTFIAYKTNEDFTNCYTVIFILADYMLLFYIFLMYTDIQI